MGSPPKWTAPRFADILRPKLGGAIALDRLTRDDPIELFLLFSSATTLLGAPGQGVYVAANVALEALARRRRAEGRPALAVAWGPIEDAGYLAERPETRDALARRLGAKPMPAAQALAALPAMLASGLAGGRLRRNQLDRGAALPADPRSAAFRRRARRRRRLPGDDSLIERLAGLDPEEALALLKTASPKKRRSILRLPAAGIDPLRPLSEMGMDSLMAVELRLALESRLRVDLPLMSLAEGTSVASIAARLANAVSARPQAAELSAWPSATRRPTTTRLAAVADAAEPFDPIELNRQRRSEPVAAGRNLFGLSAQAKARLIEKLSSAARRGWRQRPPRGARDPARRRRRCRPARRRRSLEAYREIRMIEEAADYLGIADPFFRVHEGIAGAETVDRRPLLRQFRLIQLYRPQRRSAHRRRSKGGDRPLRHLGLGEPARSPASGPIHRELEQALARIHGAEDSVALVGGHSTNVTVIGHLLGRNDVIVHDALIHNSIVQGAILSGARRVPFRHLDPEAADKVLADTRPRHGHALLVIEGHYSMDGDVPDLAAFVAVARRHRAWLMVDEAHALGVLGPRGFGSADHAGDRPGRGRHLDGDAQQEPGFVRRLYRRPQGFDRLPEADGAGLRVLGRHGAAGRGGGAGRGRNPRSASRSGCAGSTTGPRCSSSSRATAGSMSAARSARRSSRSSPAARSRAARLSQALFERGVNVQPILYPAVPERAARLRFFLTAAHSEEQIRDAVGILLEENRAVAAEPTDLAAVARHLGRRLPGTLDRRSARSPGDSRARGYGSRTRPR